MKNRLSARFNSRTGSSLNNRLFTIPNELRRLITGDNIDLFDKYAKLNRTATNIHKITQSLFINGTYRIVTPGVYILQENILFNPKHQFPTDAQKAIYPTGKDGPYHLGFFAAITIECNNVILDLNGFSITQSKRHNLIQRFFSVIELANSPFIPKQGPHPFKETLFKSATNCLIINGGLNESSHHGIHGNNNSNVILYNLRINNFEVAGIALNGSIGTVISKCRLIGKNKNIDILSTFSQAIFTLRLMKLKGGDVKESAEYKNLEREIEQAIKENMNNVVPHTTVFNNTTGQSDANMYGIVLNVNGVVVEDFLSSRNNTEGNINIVLYDNTINNVESHPVEILALPMEKSGEVKKGAYGSPRIVGAFGAVFDIEHLLSKDKIYKSTPLSAAQIYLATKFTDGLGTLNIPTALINWTKSNTSLDNYMGDQKYVAQGDSMGHFMKGNIGLFISGGNHIVVSKMVIQNVIINGEDVGNSPLLDDKERYYQGSNAYGVLLTASDNVKFNNMKVGSIISKSKNGQSFIKSTIH